MEFDRDAISDLSVSQLLATHGYIIEVLRDRDILRSKNNPVGDYAEFLTCRALSLNLADKSTKGHDATDDNGLRYEVKARRLTDDNGSRQLSAIRSLEERHFDFLIGVLFDAEFRIVRAAMIPWDIINTVATYKPHTNAWVVILRESLWDQTGVRDVTDKLVAAQKELG